MRVLVWGAIGALLFVSVSLVCHLANTTMPESFASMSPVSLLGSGFFWGAALYMIREWVGRLKHD